jgi:hypothetical protein
MLIENKFICSYSDLMKSKKILKIKSSDKKIIISILGILDKSSCYRLICLECILRYLNEKTGKKTFN